MWGAPILNIGTKNAKLRPSSFYEAVLVVAGFGKMRAWFSTIWVPALFLSSVPAWGQAQDMRSATSAGAHGPAAARSNRSEPSSRQVSGIPAKAAYSSNASPDVNPCDLNQDGYVTSSDVDLAVAMAIGSSSCGANIIGPGICDATVVQRMVNAYLGQGCLTGTNPHFVSLSWTPSGSANVIGYNVYRSTTVGGPYIMVNSSIVVGTTFLDSTVQAGQTYYYVTSAVDNTNTQSVMSNEAIAVIPTP
jgi:hypothetical protein